jgi:hypothetical protein
LSLASTNSNRSDDPFDDDQGIGWSDHLQDRIGELLDRKRSSVKGRESTLLDYLYITRHHFAKRYITGSTTEITDALLKSMRDGGSAEERVLAIRALVVTTLSVSSEAIMEQVYEPLMSLCRDSEEEKIKAECIRAIAIVVLYGGGSEVAAEEALEFLVGVIQTDGEVINATDSGAVVSAALQAWGFIASHIDDLGELVDEAMDAYVEQLDSTDVEVQTSAGANIALIFEASRDHEDETGEPFNVQYDPSRLIARMSELSKQSSKSLSKKDRRHLRSNFSSIVTSLELGKGPGYSTSGRPGFNPHTGSKKMEGDGEFQEFGYREKIRVNNSFMVIDTWSLSSRVDTMKSIFGGGFPTHFTENPVVAECLR